MNITLDRAVIEQALVTLEWEFGLNPVGKKTHETITALRTALEQPEPKPVAWMLKSGHGTEFKEKLTDELKALKWKGKPMWVPLYTAPPPRKPLTDEEIQKMRHLIDWTAEWTYITFARAIEAAHGIREESNT